jgi:hypothetical protein
MALQASGTISLDDLHVEAGGTTQTTCSLNDTDITNLVYPISPIQGYQFDDYYGKARYLDVYNYQGGSSSATTTDFTISAGSTYTTTSRTIITGFVNSTNTENIDFIAYTTANTNTRFKIDLIRASDFAYVKSGDNGTANKMFKTSALSGSNTIIFEGTTGSAGYPWGSTSTLWPIRIIADFGVVMTSNNAAREWQFKESNTYTNVNTHHFALAFDQGVQA